jgi:hypothetical protein
MRKETAMRSVIYIAATAALAGAVAGCADPYYPRYGYSQGYYYPSSTRYYQQPAYAYPPAYTYAPAYTYQTAYAYPSGYGYRSSGDYYRNYKGIHPGPEYYP